MQTPESVSRRRFIKKLAKGVAVVATLATGGLFVAQNRKKDQPSELDETSYDAYPRPEGLPEDILTREQLGKARITVYQTPDVQLYLRKEALDIPIFKDAANHQINGLTISLVDNDIMTWNAAGRLPGDAGSAWQTAYWEKNAAKWPEDYWQEIKKFEVRRIDEYQHNKRRSQLELEDILSGQEERDVRRVFDTYRNLVRVNNRKEDQQQLEYLEDQLKDLMNGEEEKRRRRAIQDAEKNEQQSRERISVLNGPRDRAVEYYQEHGISDITGSLLKPHPRWGNKAYIYLCVGKDLQPDPQQSYPKPENFRVFVKDKNSYSVYEKDPTPGFVFRHELGHYEGSDPNSMVDEEGANRVAYEGLMVAWKKYQQTGDTLGYPFVFVSPKGVTITEKPTIKPAMPSV